MNKILLGLLCILVAMTGFACVCAADNGNMTVDNITHTTDNTIQIAVNSTVQTATNSTGLNNTDPIEDTNNTPHNQVITINRTQTGYCSHLQSSNNNGNHDLTAKEEYWGQYLERNNNNTTADEDYWMLTYMDGCDSSFHVGILYLITEVAKNHSWEETVKIVTHTIHMSPFHLTDWKITQPTVTEKEVDSFMHDLANGRYFFGVSGPYYTGIMHAKLLQKTATDAGNVIHNIINLIFH